MARAVGERVGSQRLFVLGPEESLLGAIPFYTGRIPAISRGTDRLAQRLAESRARFLLAPMFLREQIAAGLGSAAVLQEPGPPRATTTACSRSPPSWPPRPAPPPRPN